MMNNEISPLQMSKQALRNVNLSYASSILEDHIRIAEREKHTYAQFIKAILDDELAHRRQRRIKERLRQSRIPVKKTIDSFDFSFPSGINKQLILSLFDFSFIREKKNVILIGPPGVGKSHISSALVFQACLNDYKCRFITAMNLISELNASLSENTFISCLKRYSAFDLLIIDELGYIPAEKQGAPLLVPVISHRSDAGSVVITTNRPCEERGPGWKGDATRAGAILARLVPHGLIIQIAGQRYRVGKD